LRPKKIPLVIAKVIAKVITKITAKVIIEFNAAALHI
jgi:hypothetical protein